MLGMHQAPGREDDHRHGAQGASGHGRRAWQGRTSAEGRGGERGPATRTRASRSRDPWHTATADDKQAADDERAAADQQAGPDSQAGAHQPAGAGSPAGGRPAGGYRLAGGAGSACSGGGGQGRDDALGSDSGRGHRAAGSGRGHRAADSGRGHRAADRGREATAAAGRPRPAAAPAPCCGPPRPPPTSAGLPGRGPCSASPDGLPEHWPGREAIHEPPHPGYREVAAPAPRPVPAGPARPRRQAPPPGTDLLNDFQRWVIRSSARSMRREIEHSVRRTIGAARAEPEDTWGVATTEPPPDLERGAGMRLVPGMPGGPPDAASRAGRAWPASPTPWPPRSRMHLARSTGYCPGPRRLPGASGRRNPVRGTPIPRVTMTMRRHLMSLAIGVDVGGTKVAAGVVDPEGKIVEKVKRPTPAASPAATEQVIVEVVTELLGRHQVDAVGIGAAGFVDETRSIVLFAPNLAWRDEPVQEAGRGPHRLRGRGRERRQRGRLGRGQVRRRPRPRRTSC